MKLKKLILDTIIYCCGELGMNLDREQLQRQFPVLPAADLEMHLEELAREGFISCGQGAAGQIEPVQAAVRTIPQIPVMRRRAGPVNRPDKNLLTLDLSPLGFVLPKETFAFQVEDSLMIEAGVGEGDIAIIAVARPKAGDIAVLAEQGGLTLRRYVEIDGIPYLMREHPCSPELLPVFGATIRGVLWSLIRIEPCHPRITATKKRFHYPPADEIEAKRQRDLPPVRSPRRKDASVIPAPGGAYMINPGSPFSFGRLSDTPEEYRARKKKKASPAVKEGLPRKNQSETVSSLPKKQESQTS